MCSFLSSLSQCAGRITLPAAACIVAALPACDLAPPETGYAPSPAARAAAYPELLTQPRIAEAVTPPPAPAAEAAPGDALAARAAALRARAAALSATGLSAEERARLEAAAAAAETR